ncbi:60 kDa inner membrane insertion protein [Brachyspira sp. CAG:484]|nr:60 kDa inner membrane insertion protein [Brachyspira sp. CAG:484]
MDFVTLTIEILKVLASFVGSYGLAIVVLTLIVRAALWPLNTSQQRSMRMMQTLQPKLKAIQDRYQNNPQVMQQKMMEFYKEHNFNPMGGCLPLLIQMPIFILLYSALMSPQFIQMAGNSKFLFINRLDTTLRASAGISNDGVMGISKYDVFVPGKTARVYLPKEVIDNVKINNQKKALEVQGEIKPGENLDLKMSLDNLGLKFNQLDQIQKAEITVTDQNTRENEKLTFTRNGGYLITSMPTVEVKKSFHWDVFALIVLFGLSIVLSQKLMMATSNKNKDSMDPTQAAIQKSMGTFMPIMIIGTFVIIPIPAGVLIYLIVSNVVQVLQTVLINKQMDMEEANKKVKATDGSKVIEAEVVVDGQPQPASLLDKLKQIYKK